MNILIVLSLFGSFILEFFLFFLIPFSFNNITFVYPMLFLSTNVLLFPYLNKNNFYQYLLFIIIYSALCLNNVVLGLELFSLIYFFNSVLKKVPIFLRLVLSIMIYDLFIYLSLVLFNNASFSFSLYFYKIFYSLLFNVIYVIIFNLVLKKIEP